MTNTWNPAVDTKPAKKNDREVFAIAAEVNYTRDMVNTNDLSGKYQVTLTNFSDAAADKLRTLGCNPLNKADKPERGNYITVKSDHIMKAYDADGSEIDPLSIGNGSKAEVVLSYYEWKNPAGKSGVSPTLVRLKITELVTYEPEEKTYEVF